MYVLVSLKVLIAVLVIPTDLHHPDRPGPHESHASIRCFAQAVNETAIKGDQQRLARHMCEVLKGQRLGGSPDLAL